MHIADRHKVKNVVIIEGKYIIKLVYSSEKHIRYAK